MTKFRTNLCGLEVGAERWPLKAAHPGCWGQPWQGVVLALDDVRAWTDTLTFRGEPTQAQATAHVEWCQGQGLLTDVVPVLWHFAEGTRVYWERTASVVPYREDLERWRAARAAEYERMRAFRARRAV